MLELNTFFENVDKNTLLLYIAISVVTLYFLTNVVQINVGHLLALIISVFIIIYITDTKNNDITDFNTDLEFKLKSILDNEPAPDYFHLDADLINLFYDLKDDFAKNGSANGSGDGNYISYRDAVISCNNILRIRNDMELKICKKGIAPVSLDNFNSQTIIEDQECDSTIENSYENYQIASQDLINCMNHLHALKYSSPSDISSSSKFQHLLQRSHLLLKRNIDIIKDIHNKSVMKKITSNTKFITDYDLAKPANSKIEPNVFF
jgi:hypothetical protein